MAATATTYETASQTKCGAMLRHGMARGTPAAIRKARFMNVFTCIHDETHVCMHVKNGGRSTPIRLGGVISTMLSSDLALVHFCCSPTRRAHSRNS